MSKVTVNFKFKVGDIVLPKTMLHLLSDREERLFEREPEIRYVILECVYRECYSNGQNFYTCQAITRSGAIGKDLITLSELIIDIVKPFRTRKEIEKDRK